MDNTEGSRVISQIFRVRKNLELRLSEEQMSILIGSILGDAYIYPQGKVCLEQAQSHKEYLFWKYSNLRSAAYPKVAKVIRNDKRTKTQTISWRFFLRQYFRPLRNTFYRDNKKVIPRSITPWLSPLLLAVWYMDDGYLDKKTYPIFMSECFSKKDNNFLVKSLKEKFHINSFINNRNRIRLRKRSAERFFKLIEPFIHETMRYKLP